jgi:hypothetical protein
MIDLQLNRRVCVLELPPTKPGQPTILFQHG